MKKMNKLDFTFKLFTLHISLLKNEKASYKLKKIFSTHITVRGPMSQVYKELLNFNKKKTNQQGKL